MLLCQCLEEVLDRLGQTATLDSGITPVENKIAAKEDINSLRAEMEKRLDEIHDAIQQSPRDASSMIGQLRSDVEPRLELLEQLHPQRQQPAF